MKIGGKNKTQMFTVFGVNYWLAYNDFDGDFDGDKIHANNLRGLADILEKKEENFLYANYSVNRKVSDFLESIENIKKSFLLEVCEDISNKLQKMSYEIIEQKLSSFPKEFDEIKEAVSLIKEISKNSKLYDLVDEIGWADELIDDITWLIMNNNEIHVSRRDFFNKNETND